MTLPDHPRIVIDPTVCGGRPIVAGTRMRVRDVLAGGATPAEITADFPYVGEEDVRAVLAYAAASPITRWSSRPNEVLIDAQLPPAGARRGEATSDAAYRPRLDRQIPRGRPGLAGADKRGTAEGGGGCD